MYKPALDKSEWLADAQRLPVGRGARIHHGAERRPNMIIRNLPDRWAAYCHSCHAGDTVMKDMVKLVQPQQMPKERLAASSNPGPLVGISSSPAVFRECVLHWQSKNMSEVLMRWANPMYSPQDRRIVYTTPDGQIGRDLTGTSNAKWHSYTNARFMRGAFREFTDKVVVITEDLYSAARVTAYLPEEYLGVAALGTRIHIDLVLELMRCKHVLLAFDGDAAGDDGRVHAQRQLSLLGIPYSAVQVPAGLDPKDLSPEQIQEWVL